VGEGGNSTISLTCGLHEGLVQSEGEQRLTEFAEEVLDDTTEYIYVFHSLKSRVASYTKKTFLHLLDHLLRAVCGDCDKSDSLVDMIKTGKEHKNGMLCKSLAPRN